MIPTITLRELRRRLIADACKDTPVASLALEAYEAVARYERHIEEDDEAALANSLAAQDEANARYEDEQAHYETAQEWLNRPYDNRPPGDYTP